MEENLQFQLRLYIQFHADYKVYFQRMPFEVFLGAFRLTGSLCSDHCSLGKGFPLKWTSLRIIAHLEGTGTSSKKDNDVIKQLII